MRPRFKSYGLNSTKTLSPGTTRMKFIRIFPEMCARTACPFWSSTLNMALGRASETVPSTSITSLFAFDGLLLANDAPATVLRGLAHAEIRGTAHGNQNCTQSAHLCRWSPTTHAATAALPTGAVSTTGPLAVHQTECSKWAERLPSAVTTVHRSASVRVSAPPMLTIGSMAMPRAPLFLGPRAGAP